MKEYKWKLMGDIITPEDKVAMSDFLLTSDRLTNGPKVKEFEEKWSAWLGCKYSLFVQSGSTANLLLVAAIKEKYGLQNGDKVLVPLCTWMTNVAPIMQLGLTPVFVDINFDDYGLDTRKILQQTTQEQREEIKMIFVTHLLGLNANVEGIKYLFPNAVIIEDICESHGVEDKTGVRRGANSEGSTFSFYFGHHMTTIEGGMVCCNDEDLYDLMRMKRSHGMARESIRFDEHVKENPDISPQFLFMTDGLNCRNDEVHAVLGLEQLTRLDSFIEARRKNFDRYISLLDPEIFYVPYAGKNNSSFCFPFVAKDKDVADRVKTLLEDAGIETRPLIAGNLMRHPFLKRLDHVDVWTDQDNANIAHEHGVYIGNNHLLTDEHFEILEGVLKQL